VAPGKLFKPHSQLRLSGLVGITSVKREMRIIGWDDAPFSFGDRHVMLIGTVFRGGSWLDGVIASKAQVDGLDSTEKIADAVKGSPHKDQLRVIMLDGITFGGFNIVDLPGLHEKTGIPVIAVVRDKPGMQSIKQALRRFGDHEARWALIRKAGPVEPLEVRNPKTGRIKKVWFQYSGVEPETARRIIRMSSTRSFMPEPLRVAHLIGHGIGGRR
jgi:endonuclease V-like protein UPF0215 family